MAPCRLTAVQPCAACLALRPCATTCIVEQPRSHRRACGDPTTRTHWVAPVPNPNPNAGARAGTPALTDPDQTLEALGLDNRAMVVMRWA